MKVNDKVVTHHGEVGYIVKPVVGNTAYNWWVEFKTTTVDGKRITCREPYREKELRNFVKSS